MGCDQLGALSLLDVTNQNLVLIRKLVLLDIILQWPFILQGFDQFENFPLCDHYLIRDLVSMG